MLRTEELIQKFAMLKRNCFASVFEKYFDYQQAGSGGESHAVINYREDESMWVEQFLFTFSFFISSNSGGNCIITIYSSTEIGIYIKLFNLELHCALNNSRFMGTRAQSRREFLSLFSLLLGILTSWKGFGRSRSITCKVSHDRLNILCEGNAPPPPKTITSATVWQELELEAYKSCCSSRF